jgi:hypothetical protein
MGPDMKAVVVGGALKSIISGTLLRERLIGECVLLVTCATVQRFPALHNSPQPATYDISVSEVPIPQLSTTLEPDYGARAATATPLAVAAGLCPVAESR